MRWSTAKLSDIADIERSQVDPRQISPGTSYLGLEHIEAGGRILGAQSVSSGDLKSAKFVFGTEHLLYGKLRPYLAKISLPEFEGICSTDILPVRPGPDLDRKFLAYYLRQPSVVQEANGRSTGANLPRLSPKSLSEMYIPCPPISEQRRIAAILDKADAIRRKREQAFELAEEFLKSVFMKMFFGQEMEWPTAKMRSVAELINGDRSSNYPSGKDIVTDGVLFLSTKNISNSRIVFPITQFITKEKFDSLSRGKLQKNDLLVTLRGSIGQCAIFDCEYETGFINAQLMILRPSQDLAPTYLHRLMTHPVIQRKLTETKSGSAIPQLTARQIGDLDVPVPPLDVQRKFAEMERKVASIYSSMTADKTEAEALFGSISQRAFRGEL